MQPLLKGMPVRLALLDFGLFQVHEDGRKIGICGYVIQTSENETVLIDSGFPPQYAKDPQAATAADKLDSFGQVLKLTSDNLVPAQLEKLGLGMGGINLMIQSHTHIDHVGYMASFPGVPIVISRAERALPKPLYWSGNPVMEWPEADYIVLEQDTQIGPAFDVLHVPGHAPGQLAFSLYLPRTGPVVLTSDAISRPAELDTEFQGAWDAALAKQNAERLMDLARRDRAMLVFGHCPEQWKTLRKAPDWYT